MVLIGALFGGGVGGGYGRELKDLKDLGRLQGERMKQAPYRELDFLWEGEFPRKL